ncbi:hypothetical protein AB0A74_18425 [Saccharothrix sp. NPDC042600]|uniref:hypothetical protein n=1 Tax=Saccharothrix TaxID=2071 RepID=UPI0033F14652|nr:hypothetical protein GCM10017745_51740 [Saccharothrix mutabilis subsp. capreolus]
MTAVQLDYSAGIIWRACEGLGSFGWIAGAALGVLTAAAAIYVYRAYHALLCGCRSCDAGIRFSAARRGLAHLIERLRRAARGQRLRR